MRHRLRMNSSPTRPTGLEVRGLIRAARSARRRAYAPYSRFPVGAAVLTASGAIVTGCNVENASFGLSVCAERAAIHRAIAEGHRRLIAVAVATGASSSMPCGACRQVMLEFGVGAVIVDRRQRPLTFDLSELLAHPFGADSLPQNTSISRRSGVTPSRRSATRGG